MNRRANLLKLLETISATELATAIATKTSHLSAMKAGNRGMGDELAARIERRYGERRPAGWMDRPTGPAAMGELDGYEGQLITLFRQVDPGTQHAMLADLNNRVAAIAKPAPSTGVSKLEPKVARTDGSERRGLRKNADQKRRHLGVAKQGEGKK